MPLVCCMTSSQQHRVLTATRQTVAFARLDRSISGDPAGSSLTRVDYSEEGARFSRWYSVNTDAASVDPVIISTVADKSTQLATNSDPANLLEIALKTELPMNELQLICADGACSTARPLQSVEQRLSMLNGRSSALTRNDAGTRHHQRTWSRSDLVGVSCSWWRSIGERDVANHGPVTARDAMRDELCQQRPQSFAL
jgi:hypothetical protein